MEAAGAGADGAGVGVLEVDDDDDESFEVGVAGEVGELDESELELVEVVDDDPRASFL